MGVFLFFQFETFLIPRREHFLSFHSFISTHAVLGEALPDAVVDNELERASSTMSKPSVLSKPSIMCRICHANEESDR